MNTSNLPSNTGDAESSAYKKTQGICLLTLEQVKLPNKTLGNPNEIHVLEPLPSPYPKYPTLISRVISVPEARRIDFLYGVSDLPPTGLDSMGLPLNYKKLAWRVFQEGENCLAPYEEAFLQFGNVLYFFCYEQDSLQENLILTWNTRHAKGAIARNLIEKVAKIKALEENQVDQILERALQRMDFEAIRAVLNYEGYGIPINEPNELVIPAGIDTGELDDIEIQISPEEYKEWQAPLEELYEPESFEPSQIQLLFMKVMAENVPLHLERAIRQRDVHTLRLLLRLHGHDISPNQPGDQEDLLESDIIERRSDEPPPQEGLHGNLFEPQL